MPDPILTRIKCFWKTPTPVEQPMVSISTGWRFLLFFCLFFVVVKLNDPLDEILHIFRIGFAVLCGCLVAGLAEALYWRFTRRRLVTSFGRMFLSFLLIYSMAVGFIYLFQWGLQGAVGEGWIWRYYWRHLPFAMLVIGLYLYREVKLAVGDQLAAQLNAVLGQTHAETKTAQGADQRRPPLRFDVNGIVSVVPPNTIVAVSVNGHYLDIHYLKDEQVAYLSIRKPLSDIRAELPGDLFVKIHRSHIVNLNFIQRLKKVKRRFFVKLLHIDLSLPISRSHLPQVLARMEQTP